MECTESFTTLLSEFRCVFTAPSFQTFVCLMTGWVLSHRRRFVTELIWSSGCTQWGHHSGYHRFFSQAVWGLDGLCEVLAKLLVLVFAPGGLIELAVDDSLCRKRGLTVYGTGMHHDPLISSRAKPLTSWGHDWVVVTLIVRCPFWAPTKVWSLPIAFRLYRNRQGLTKGKKKAKAKKQRQPKRDPNHRTRPELAVELISLVASWFPQRKLLVSGDNRKEPAVRRTAPMALVLYSLIVTWFHQVGHRHLQFPDRPWYRQKKEPSFADMLTTLRRLSWQDKFRGLPCKSRLLKKALAQIVDFLSLAG